MTVRKTIFTCFVAIFGAAISLGQHKVQSGDTLEKIAKKHGTTVKALLTANNLKNPNALKLGQTITIPSQAKAAPKATNSVAKASTGQVNVAQGQNATTIARAHGLTVVQLKQLNPGIDLNKLQIGQLLTVKKAAPVVAKAPTKSAAPAAASKSAAAKVPAAKVAAAKPAPSQAASSRFVSVKASAPVNVRQTPATNGKRLATVREGQLARVIESRNDWRKVQFAGGTIGWIKADFLAASTESAYQTASKLARTQPTERKNVVASKAVDRQSLLGFAHSMIGTRYRYGAMSRSATDCSGFTLQVFRSQGISLPRTSAAQSRVGTFVPRNSLKPGDLVFFRTRGGSRVSHVGIYIGSDKFIHASTTNLQVRVDSLNGSYYRTRYVTARRVGKFSVESKSIPVAYVADDQIEIALSEEDMIPVVDPAPLRGIDEIGR